MTTNRPNFSLENKCRTCLENNTTLVSLFLMVPDSNIPLSNILLEITSVKVSNVN